MHFVGIAEKQRAVGISALHRLDQQMKLLRLIGMRQIVAFENVEHLDQFDAARGRRRHRDDVVAAIGAAHRRALDGAVTVEIVGRHYAAGGLHGGGDFVRDRPLVEGARALARDRLERVGEIALDQAVAGGHRTAVGLEEDFRRRRPARQPRPLVRQRLRPVVGEGDAVARQAIAGAIRSARVKRPEPYLSSAKARPATVPGTPMASAESRDFCGSALPCASRKLLALMPRGAVSR